jgi:hypothetical protein
MRRMAVLLLGLGASAAAAPVQEQVFESADYGIRLKIPQGWNIDATRQQRVLLKLNQAVDSLIKPELMVYEAPFSDPITLGQYREQLRHFLQRAYKEPRMLDDRPATAGGKPGFILAIGSRGANDTEVVSFKGIFELSPRRMLGVDGVFPKGKEEELLKVYDKLLASIELFPRKSPAGTEEEVKRFAEAVPKLAAKPAPAARKDEMEISSGGRSIGTYTFSMGPSTQGAVHGIEVETDYRIDLGEEGRIEVRVKGFMTHDLAHQTVHVEDVRTSKDKRTQNFTADVTLKDGEVRSERRINGEKSAAQFKLAGPAVLSELAEALQVRMLDLGKNLVSAPSVPAFENETGTVKLEVSGLHKMKADDEMTEINVSFLVREDGLFVTYWYDGAGRLIRITHPNQSLVMKRKK